MIETFSKLIQPLKLRLFQMIGRYRILNVNDNLPMQVFQIGNSKSDVQNGIERIQNYGFTSVPPEHSEAVVLFPGGLRDHGIALGADHREKRLKGLSPGESAIYNDFGVKIVLDKNGKLEISCGSKELISILSKLAEEISKITTIVPGSPSPVPILNASAFTIIAAELKSFQSGESESPKEAS
jgi:phage baseplate assembly protein V